MLPVCSSLLFACVVQSICLSCLAGPLTDAYSIDFAVQVFAVLSLLPVIALVALGNTPLAPDAATATPAAAAEEKRTQ